MFSSFKSSFRHLKSSTTNETSDFEKKIGAIQGNIAWEVHDLWMSLLRRQIKDIDLQKNVSFWHTREYCRNDCNADFYDFHLFLFLCESIANVNFDRMKNIE
jgi:hypothetical protein